MSPVIVVGEPSAATRAALEAQTVHVSLQSAPLERVPQLAGDGRLWLVAPDAVPEPDALERLLEAAQETPAPLLASLPVDSTGAIVEAALPRGDEAGTPLLLASVPHRRVPIRRAPLTSLLVDARAARATPVPEEFGPLAATAWTGRLLRAEPGYLVLASRVRVPAPAGPPLRALPAVARLRREHLLTTGEAVRLALSSRPRR